MVQQQKYSGMLYDVTREEFGKLKEVEKWWLNEISQGKDPLFFKTKYNLGRGTVGIYFGAEDESKLVASVSELPLKGPERGCFNRLFESLEKALDRLKLDKEKWSE